MYEQINVNNWIVGLYSLSDPANFLSFSPNFWHREFTGRSYPIDTKVRDIDVIVGYLILVWVILYLLYEKCLNSLLRRMRFPLVQRNRIIQAAWNCGFCFGSICYVKSSAVQILSFASQGVTIYQELGVMLHKSFYFHQAVIDVLCHGAWLKGCANLLFASLILNPYQQKWCTVTNVFLMYRAIDIVIVNVCRILLCIFQTGKRRVCKLLFLLHCLNWMYLYLIYVPTSIFWLKEINYIKWEFGLMVWFTAECLNSVVFRLVRHAKAVHWLEISLFPPPTQEAIELASIHKKYKESLKGPNNKAAKKVEMWQTLLCALTIKKKLKRIRQVKSNNTDLSTEDLKETELHQTDIRKDEKMEDLKETELHQTHVNNEEMEVLKETELH